MIGCSYQPLIVALPFMVEDVSHTANLTGLLRCRPFRPAPDMGMLADRGLGELSKARPLVGTLVFFAIAQSSADISNVASERGH